MDKKKIEELRSKVAKAKEGGGTILKFHQLEGEIFSIQVSRVEPVNGQYGEQTLIVGEKDGSEVRLYLNGNREKVFLEAFDGLGEYAFVVGEARETKDGYSYVPLELVEKL